MTSSPKIVAVGNCQIEWFCKFAEASGCHVKYFSTSSRYRKDAYDIGASLEAIKNADIAIVQTIHNTESPYYFRKIKKILPDVILAPYVYLDGIFSLVQVQNSFIGQEYIVPEIRKYGPDKTLYKLRRGMVDFNLRERLVSSLNKGTVRETVSDVKSYDIIEDLLPSYLPLVTQNHPCNIVMEIVAHRISKLAGFRLIKLHDISRSQIERLRLPKMRRVLSPLDVSVHGFNYVADEDWFEQTIRIVRSIHGKLSPT